MNSDLEQELADRLEGLDVELDNPERIAAAHEMLDRPVPASVGNITRELAIQVGAPFASVTVLDEHQQYFLATSDGAMDSCSRDDSHCQYVVGTGFPLVINNTQSSSFWRRTVRNVIHGRRLQAYLGLPLKNADGITIGAVCVVDLEPRNWTANDHYLVHEATMAIQDALA